MPDSTTYRDSLLGQILDTISKLKQLSRDQQWNDQKAAWLENIRLDVLILKKADESQWLDTSKTIWVEPDEVGS